MIRAVLVYLLCMWLVQQTSHPGLQALCMLAGLLAAVVAIVRTIYLLDPQARRPDTLNSLTDSLTEGENA